MSSTTPPQETVVAKTDKVDTITKPEKPDEATHKAVLAKLEAEHKAAMAQLVSTFNSLRLHLQRQTFTNCAIRPLSARRLTSRSQKRMRRSPQSAFAPTN